MGILDSSIIEQIQIKSIHPSNLDPRTKFYSNDIEQLCLARSIKEQGLIQPILVRPVSHGFEIVSGHSRRNFLPDRDRGLESLGQTRVDNRYGLLRGSELVGCRFRRYGFPGYGFLESFHFRVQFGRA